MKSIFRAGFVLSCLCGPAAFSQAPYQCTSGDLVRRVEVVYESDAPVPCEVHYIKETEAPGTRDVLWNAQNEAGYCESRAQEFVAELSSTGWTCSAMEVSDDSAVLAPAEE